MRTARIARKTNETDITLTICLDGRGVSAIQSGVGFQIGRASCRERV